MRETVKFTAKSIEFCVNLLTFAMSAWHARFCTGWKFCTVLCTHRIT